MEGAKKKIILIFGFLCILLWSYNANAASLNEVANFNVDTSHDSGARSRVEAVLIKVSSKLYFYVEKNWWDQQAKDKQNEILANLDVISSEFENKIYPTLTSVFGKEWTPGVDGDEKITLLFHQMKEGAAGYFRTVDEYIKLQLPDSNEKEMLYLSVDNIDSTQLKIFLAHEFMHLVTFNQKNRILGVQEDVWLNEGRADFSSNILGYDNAYATSNLQKRVQAFLEKPSDSLTEWQEKKYDYGVVTLFANYLVDHYGIDTLSDSIKQKTNGFESINYVLKKNGQKDDFSQIFTNWIITVLVNDCSLGSKYCYLNENLKNFRINPSLNFLPLTGDSSLSVTNVTKNWSGNWQKIIGGKGSLKLTFFGLKGLDFKVPYLILDKFGKYKLNFLALDRDQKGEINIDKFGDEKISLIIMPMLENKFFDSEGSEPTYPYTFTVSIKGQTTEEDQSLIQKLLEQIESLKKQIAEIISKQNSNNQQNVCSINQDLYIGISNLEQVKCLQTFLKNQGQGIYPEGFVTGNFGNLTKQAVIKFQEKYKSEILLPLGISQGTGFVGNLTRQKINLLIAK